MAKLKMTIELDYDDDIMHGDDEDGIYWFFNDILKGVNMSLFEAFEIGDFIGPVKVIEITSKDDTIF